MLAFRSAMRESSDRVSQLEAQLKEFDGAVAIRALDPKSPYYDPKAQKQSTSPWIMVDVLATHRLKQAVTRQQLKSAPALKNMMVLRRGARLSVQPVTEAEFSAVLRIGEPEPLK